MSTSFALAAELGFSASPLSGHGSCEPKKPCFPQWPRIAQRPCSCLTVHGWSTAATVLSKPNKNTKSVFRNTVAFILDPLCSSYSLGSTGPQLKRLKHSFDRVVRGAVALVRAGSQYLKRSTVKLMSYFPPPRLGCQKLTKFQLFHEQLVDRSEQVVCRMFQALCKGRLAVERVPKRA